MGDSQQIPQLKAGAVVNVAIGSAFIGKIQECFQGHILGHEQELQDLKAKEGNYDKTPLTVWEDTAIMFTTLLQELMRRGEEQGMVEYVSMESLIPKNPIQHSGQPG